VDKCIVPNDMHPVTFGLPTAGYAKSALLRLWAYQSGTQLDARRLKQQKSGCNLPARDAQPRRRAVSSIPVVLLSSPIRQGARLERFFASGLRQRMFRLLEVEDGLGFAAI